ncbi:MAG: histidine kinase [Cytophagales bacterium]|nr:histidine kinase [Cytophagales bacterium]
MQNILTHTNLALRNFFAAAFVGMALGLLLYSYLSFSEVLLPDLTFESGVYSALVGLLVALGSHTMNLLLNKFIPWRKNLGGRFIVGIIGSLILIWALVVMPFQIFVSDDYETLVKLDIILLLITLIYNVIYFAVYSYYQFSTAQLQFVENERRQMALQLDALRSQLSPHFLFNCLNTISSLLYKDLNKAEDFIRQLATTYQFTLDTQKQPIIPLEKELDFVRAYKYLLNVRFENLVQIKIELSDRALNTVIPPMTIQLLVENAVKHNVISKDNQLRIHVYNSGNWLVISNNKTKKPAKTTSFRIGLENIKNRYMLLNKKDIQVKDEEEFSILLPLLRL